MPGSAITVQFGGDDSAFIATTERVNNASKAMAKGFDKANASIEASSRQAADGLEQLARKSATTYNETRNLRRLLEFGGISFALNGGKQIYQTMIDYAEKDTAATDDQTEAVRRFGAASATTWDTFKAGGVQALGVLNEIGEGIGDGISRLVYGNKAVDQFDQIADDADAIDAKLRDTLTTKAKLLGIATDKEWEGLTIEQQLQKVIEAQNKAKETAAKNAQAAAEKLAATNKEIDRLKYEALSTDEKVLATQQEIQAAYDALALAEDGTDKQKIADATLSLYEATAQMAALQEGIQSKQAEADKAHAAALQAEIKAQEEIRDRIKQQQAAELDKLKDAADALALSHGDYATANRNRASRSLQEIANGAPGVLPDDQYAAQNVLRLEEQAKEDEAHSKTQGDDYDKKAADDLKRADAIRGTIHGLNSSDADPLKSQRDAITRAQSTLDKIGANLAKLTAEALS